MASSSGTSQATQAYMMGYSDEEALRLNSQHLFLRHAQDDRLLAPQLEYALRSGEIKNVLDIGTGTGVWCFDAAAEMKDIGTPGPVTFVGIDVVESADWAQFSGNTANGESGTQPYSNFKFQTADLNDDAALEALVQRHGPFDLVHSRLLISSIRNGQWPAYLGRVFKALRPGGYVQLFEIDLVNWAITCDDRSALEYRTIFQAVYNFFDLDVEATVHLASRLRKAGFTNVKEITIFVDSCTRKLDGCIARDQLSQEWFETTARVLRPLFIRARRAKQYPDELVNLLSDKNQNILETDSSTLFKDDRYDDFERRFQQTCRNDPLFCGVFRVVLARKPG